MQVKAIKVYKDTELGRMTKLDEIIDVSDERGKYLISIGYAEEVYASYGRKSKNMFEGEENG